MYIVASSSTRNESAVCTHIFQLLDPEFSVGCHLLVYRTGSKAAVATAGRVELPWWSFLEFEVLHLKALAASMSLLLAWRVKRLLSSHDQLLSCRFVALLLCWLTGP